MPDGESLAADLLGSPSASSSSLDFLAELRLQSRDVERRPERPRVVALAEDALVGELHELGTQHVESTGSQAHGNRVAAAAPGDEVAGLDLEEVVQMHVALGFHLLAVLELQDRLVGARLRPAVPHWQVLAVECPDVGLVVLALDASLAERCHLEASGDLHPVLTLVDVPDHAWVAFHLVVDVGLLFEQQRGGQSCAFDARLVNEAREDAGAARMLVKIGRCCSGISALTQLEV